MKTELSSIDLFYLLKELQEYVGGIVQKAYQEGEEISIELYHSQEEKRFLTISKRLLFLSKKRKYTDKQARFCQLLRKHITRARVISIEHIAGQRVVKIVLQKERSYHLYIELYGKANTILCTEKNIILGALHQHTRSDQVVKKGEEYVTEERDNLLEWNKEKFVKHILQSEDNASKTIAKHVGKVYATETCLQAGIDNTTEIHDKEKAKKLYYSFRELLKQDIKTTTYITNDKIVDITPFPLQYYEGKESREHESLSAAYQAQYELTFNVEDSKHQQKADKLTKRIKIQEENFAKLEEKVKENQRKGEMIYEHYQELQTIITALQEARKNMSWKDIKENIKNPLVKEINDAKGEIVVEL